jgi:leucyl/phenylalanyl-tRNA--protein transferase
MSQDINDEDQDDHSEDQVISPYDMLHAYSIGLFPMAESADATTLFWFDPPERGILSIPHLHIPQSLRKQVRKAPYDIRINCDFRSVIKECATARGDKEDDQTWINQEIIDIFTSLHDMGFAHSVEAYQDTKDGPQLVGGLYGVALGGAFFGESMFTRATNASKICLVHLCARLWHAGFDVLDTQFTNPHLEQFGITTIPRAQYHKLLKANLEKSCDFYAASSLEDRHRIAPDILSAYLAQNKT